jgi:hypothetical protein
MKISAVEVLLTREQIAAISDWEEQLARFQSQWDVVAADIREKSRQCIHEGSHVLYNRRYGRDVHFHKPRAEYDGELKFTFGSVSPILNDENWLLTDWENAAISMAGFTVVERLTGLPEVEEVTNNDLRILTRKLEHSLRLPSVPEDFSERLEQAKHLGEYTILTDLEQPEFLRDLERAVHDYEREIFQTDEVWEWAARQYRFDLPGERFAVGHDGLNWLLVDDGSQLRLLVDGVEVSPDKKYELYFVCGGASASERAVDAVRRWNEKVMASV